ncbi:MAG: hypothetical protein HOG15_14790 [Anaerolineae bacterium]|jgi:hypothetical protein|nr:hypothetical protein [Anaerolineae bacterium]
MTKNISPKVDSKEKKGRLQNPILFFLSIALVIFSFGLAVYSLENVLIIPIVMILAFLLLWFSPRVWTWIEELFGKRPRTNWGRFSMNLAIATFTAVVLEDVIDFIRKGIRLFFRLLNG